MDCDIILAGWDDYNMEYPDIKTQALIVEMILNKRTEESIQLLSRFYNIHPPEIVVGTIKGKRKTVRAVYVGKERGSEKGADNFASRFIDSYRFLKMQKNRL
ncbi:MAG: hypothetical protein E6L04_02190 [Thaumarchaeota archaeon]|nr:MAG: hypothetical protein E6L04_02190 [Nitrososphaerota archaeon]